MVYPDLHLHMPHPAALTSAPLHLVCTALASCFGHCHMKHRVLPSAPYLLLLLPKMNKYAPTSSLTSHMLGIESYFENVSLHPSAPHTPLVHLHSPG